VTKQYFIWKLAYLGVAAGIFLIDQTTKAWVTRSLRFSDMPLIEGFLNLTYAQNPGVAFSMFDQQGDAGRWGLSIVALVAGALVLYFFWRTPRTDDRVMGALALLLAGIAGNVTDRIRLGHVIDFIDVQFGNWHYPTFNVADSAICIGAGLLLIDMVLSKKNQKSKIESQNSEVSA
jgi:signal peptidase II